MSKEEYSDRDQERNNTRRGGQDHGNYGGKEAALQAGAELRKQGAHSNTGVGDEKNSIRENEGE